jgi:nucleoid DNA-binding protein
MIYEEFITEVAGSLEWTEEKTAGAVEAILEVMTAELKMNNQVVIAGFGTLKTDIRPEYILVNRETEERRLMPPATEVVFEASFQGEFTPDEALYDELNNSFAPFEPTPLHKGVQLPGISEVVAEEPEQKAPVVAPPPVVEYRTVPETPAPPEYFEQAGPVAGKSKSGKRISPLWIPVAGGVAIIIAAFFFSRGKEAGRAEMRALAAQEDVAPAREEETETKTDTASFAEKAATPPAVKPAAPPKKPKKTVLPPGKTLRLLAEDVYGNREFWVYIYLENKDKIRNPNRVPSGIELRLPDRAAYAIDAADPQSVAKAKALGYEILAKF